MNEIAEACHAELVFEVESTSFFSSKGPGFTVAQFHARLQSLATKLGGFRRAFEYIQGE